MRKVFNFFSGVAVQSVAAPIGVVAEGMWSAGVFAAHKEFERLKLLSTADKKKLLSLHDEDFAA